MPEIVKKGLIALFVIIASVAVGMLATIYVNQSKNKNIKKPDEKTKIVIAGSYRKYLKEVCEIKNKLEQQGNIVLEPACKKVINEGSEFIVMEGDTASAPTEEDMKKIEDKFLNSIRESDYVYLVNINGYIGASSNFEIGFARGLGKKIICLEEPSDYGLKVAGVCDEIRKID